MRCDVDCNLGDGSCDGLGPALRWAGLVSVHRLAKLSAFVHFVTDHYDEGPVITSQQGPVLPGDTT